MPFRELDFLIEDYKPSRVCQVYHVLYILTVETTWVGARLVCIIKCYGNLDRIRQITQHHTINEFARIEIKLNCLEYYMQLLPIL